MYTQFLDYKINHIINQQRQPWTLLNSVNSIVDITSTFPV